MLAAKEAWLPIVVRQRIDAHALARGGVDELVFAEVDAAVGRALFIRLEKDEIAGYEFLRALCAQSEFVLLVCRARNRDTLFLENVLEVARAVKALRCCASEYIGRPHVGFRRLDDIGYLARGKDGLSVRGKRLLLLRTGFVKYKFTDPDRYAAEGVSLHPGFCRYLNEEFPDLMCIGMDFLSVASPTNDYGVEAHHWLLGNYNDHIICAIEDMPLDALADHRIKAITLGPLRVKGIDSSQLCAMAWVE